MKEKNQAKRKEKNHKPNKGEKRASDKGQTEWNFYWIFVKRFEGEKVLEEEE